MCVKAILKSALTVNDKLSTVQVNETGTLKVRQKCCKSVREVRYKYAGGASKVKYRYIESSLNVR